MAVTLISLFSLTTQVLATDLVSGESCAAPLEEIFGFIPKSSGRCSIDLRQALDPNSICIDMS